MNTQDDGVSLRQYWPLLVFIAAILLIAAVGTANAWVSHIDCEGGTVGTKTKEAQFGAFTSSFMRTVYSDEQVAGGRQSCKMGISKGSEGWGEWGGLYQFPTKLYQGSNLWIRVNLYVPTTFNYTGQPWLKFMRVHTASPSNSNQGYLDLYINQPTGTVWDASLRKDVAAPFTFYYEGRPIPHTLGARPGNDIVKGKWESYEIHYALDDVPKNKGGTGSIRIWKNNVLLADLPDQVTLADSATYAQGFYLFTYWNGNGPATQSLYVDDVIITTDTPARRDAAGNAFIGGAVPQADPTPPPVPTPPPAPVLAVSEPIAYRLNGGTNNRYYLSRVGSIATGKECIESMPVMGGYVVKDRMAATLDNDPNVPGQKLTRPRQVIAMCRKG